MNKKCEDKIDDSLESLADDMVRFMGAEDDETWEEYHTYGLSFNYVAAGTFEDQDMPYYSYQISWGGPSSEIRFYPSGKVRYYFMDWFDGAYRNITGEDWVEWLKDDLEEVGAMKEGWEQW